MAPDRLNSWKEIAVYLDTSVRTVQRWELSEGLPVHRHEHLGAGTVYAYATEVDAWLANRRKPEAPPARRILPLRVAALFGTVAVAVGAGLWVWLGRSSPQPRLVTLTGSPGVESAPAFSPDGRQIAYSWRPEDQEQPPGLYIKLVGPGQPLHLIRGFDPAWSPDGRSIAYCDGSGIYLIPALGGQKRKVASVEAVLRLFPVFPAGRRPAWFPDGKRLAIVDLDPATGFPSIFELSIDTGERRKLTSAISAWGDLRPAVSPDGKTLGFLRSKAGAVMAVHLMPASGGEPRQLTRFEEGAFDFAWTADSREILYCGNPLGYSTLWRVPAAGGTPRQVIEVGYGVREPAVASAENRMAFTRQFVVMNLWRVDLDRPDPPRKLAATSRAQRAPQFSPDGKRLAFESNRSGWGEIWTSDSEGQNLVQLTSMGAADNFAGTPRWSPDGAEIVFDARPGGNPEIFVVNAQGGAPRRITAHPAEDVVPSFSRDARWIYFASNRGGDFQVWKAPRSGGDAVQVTRQGGFWPMESPDGKYLYYVKPSGSARLWRMPVGGGTETPALEDTLSGWKGWAVTDRGVLYLGADPALKLFDAATGTTANFVTLPSRPADFALSPDGRTLVYSQVDQRSSNIMLLENFR